MCNIAWQLCRSTKTGKGRVQSTAGGRNPMGTAPPRVFAAVTVIGNAPLHSGYDYQGRRFFVNTRVSF